MCFYFEAISVFGRKFLSKNILAECFQIKEIKIRFVESDDQGRKQKAFLYTLGILVYFTL